MTIGRGRGAALAAMLGGAVVMQAMLATPASAQWFFGPPVPAVRGPWFFGSPVLPERAVVSVLRQEGFRRISPPVLNRDVYVLNAIDPYGEAVRVVLDAYNGHILQAHLRSNAPWVQVDPYEPEPAPPPVAPRRQPRKQAAAPEPALREPAPPPPSVTPAPKLDRPPVVRPKAKAPEKPAAAPPVATAPGTKEQPRVIPIAPQAAPPVVPLDDVKPLSTTPAPAVPVAPLE